MNPITFSIIPVDSLIWIANYLFDIYGGIFLLDFTGHSSHFFLNVTKFFMDLNKLDSKIIISMLSHPVPLELEI